MAQIEVIEMEFYALNCGPSKKYVEVLTPGNRECVFVQKQGHYRYDQLKGGHTGVGWTPDPVLLCPYKKAASGSQKHTGRSPCKDTRLESCIYSKGTPKIAGSPPEARKGSSTAFRGRLVASRTVRKLHVCCFKPSRLWCFVMVTLGN